MKRLIKNDGTLLFGYWIHTHWQNVPESYLDWACRSIHHFDEQLERVKNGLDPIPGINDGTKALPTAKHPMRKQFVSRQVRPNNMPSDSTTMEEPASTCRGATRRGNAAKHEEVLRALISNGHSLSSIARVTKLSKATITSYIKELGLPKPVDGRQFNSPPTPSNHTECVIHWTPELDEHIKRLRARGMSWKNVAKALGLPISGDTMCSRWYARVRHLRMTSAKPIAPKVAWWRFWTRFKNWLLEDDE